MTVTVVYGFEVVQISDNDTVLNIRRAWPCLEIVQNLNKEDVITIESMKPSYLSFSEERLFAKPDLAYKLDFAQNDGQTLVESIGDVFSAPLGF